MDAATDLNVRFMSDERRFEKSLVDTFGRFYTHKELKQNYWNSLTNLSSGNGGNGSVPSIGGSGDSDSQPPSMLSTMSRQQQLINLQQLQQLQHTLNSSKWENTREGRIRGFMHPEYG